MTIRYKKLPNLDDGTEAMTVRRIETGEPDVCVPIHPPSCLTNTYYVEYKAWLDAGNTPEAA
tara:strand:- start:45 stop:230 length:186 start_codon:yes stop_codon:yes gene_type:complete